MNQADRLLTLLFDGPLKSIDIRQRLGGVSPATLSRLVRSIGPQVVALGRGRSTRYARPRDVRGLGSRQEVYRIDEHGDAIPVGNLIAVYHRGYWFESINSTDRSKYYPSLPWFVSDMRPDGFVGRAFANRVGGDLGLPHRLNDWNDDHVLVALARRGEDIMGNLVVGRESIERYLQSVGTESVTPVTEDMYPEYAERAMAGDPAGSSAGGEQPKFTCYVERAGIAKHVLVKFSPVVTSPEGRRWSDLLVCEHIALDIVREAGIQAAASTLLQLNSRTFLEVERFDRLGTCGRKPTHSLGVVDDEFFGERDNWTAMASRLADARMMSAEECQTLVWLDSFGELIANTDRHFGNVSLIPVDESREKFRLAPAYDMLPMYYRPKEKGEAMQSTAYSPNLSLGFASNGRDTLSAAVEFWERAAHDQRISTEFRATCLQNLEVTRRLSTRPRMIR